MKRPLYISTGALVGRVNSYDLDGALNIIRSFADRGLCSGMELMMLTVFYGKTNEVVRAVKDCGVPVLAGLPIAFGGLLSAIYQGKVAVAGINMVAKKPTESGKGMVMAIMVETYAVLSMLISFLLVIGIH